MATETTERITTSDSSNIASFAYSPKTSVLTVEFKNAAGTITATWGYSKVPASIFAQMKLAQSKGSFLRARVIGYFDSKKV